MAFLGYGGGAAQSEEAEPQPLATAIEDAFTVEELDQLVTLTFGKKLYDEYLPERDLYTFKTGRLLEVTTERGTFPQFLRAIRKARPESKALLQAIARSCPSAMGDAQAAREAVETVRLGLMAIAELRSDKERGAIVSALLDRVAGEADICRGRPQ